MKTETVNGTLTKIDGKWFVKHPYGPAAILAEELQSRPSPDSEGCAVTATIECPVNIAVDYHFTDAAKLD